MLSKQTIRAAGPVLAGTVLGGVFSVLSALLVLTQQSQVQEGLVLVVASPWGISAHDILRQADLPEVSVMRAPFGALTKLEQASDSDRLYAHGAWLLLEAKRIAFLCS
jgi:hypothetical protein